MRKFIIRLLLRWYVNNLKRLEVTKLTSTEELKAYTFKDPILTEKLIKSCLTAQTLWHFEASNEEERLMAKGAAMILKIIKTAHEKAIEVNNPQNPDESLKKWLLFKKTHRIN